MAEAAGEEASVSYAAVLTPGEDGWVCAQVAEVPAAISQGRTLEEAKAAWRRRSSWHCGGGATRGRRSPTALR